MVLRNTWTVEKVKKREVSVSTSLPLLLCLFLLATAMMLYNIVHAIIRCIRKNALDENTLHTPTVPRSFQTLQLTPN